MSESSDDDMTPTEASLDAIAANLGMLVEIATDVQERLERAFPTPLDRGDEIRAVIGDMRATEKRLREDREAAIGWGALSAWSARLETALLMERPAR